MKYEQFNFKDNEGKDGKPPTPFLLIPYSGSDNGDRPLPPSIVFWNCPGIHINGVPYQGTPLQAGVEINLSVIVKNAGALGTGAVVRVYWADPTTGFTQSSLHLIGQTLLYIPAVNTLESPGLRWTPNSSMPAHSCLLVEVTSALDVSSGTYNVLNDRHYAQTNINILLGHPGEKVSFEFNAGNAGAEKAEYSIGVHQLQEETMKMLEKQYKAEAIHIPLDGIYLRAVEPGLRQRRSQELNLVLPSQSQGLCQVIMEVPQNLKTNQFFAFEIQQVNIDDKKVIGAIGLIVFAK